MVIEIVYETLSTRPHGAPSMTDRCPFILTSIHSAITIFYSLMYDCVSQAQRPNSMWLNKKESQAKPESPDSTTHKSDPPDSSRLSKYALKQEKKRLKKDAKVSYKPCRSKRFSNQLSVGCEVELSIIIQYYQHTCSILSFYCIP